MAWAIIRGVGGALAGSLGGTTVFIIVLMIDDDVSGYQGPLSSRLGDATDGALLLSILWLCCVPALAAAMIAAIIGGAGGGWQISRRLAAIGIGSFVGSIVSPLSWNLLRDAQGPNPIMFAGFVSAALCAAVFMVLWSPAKR